VDGWASTHQAWLLLFPLVALLRCFLHGWLDVRSRGKRDESFAGLSERVWHAYHAPTRRSFGQRMRRLWEWARANVSGAWLLEQVKKLCGRSKEYAEAYGYPGGHRTSNMLDRVMRDVPVLRRRAAPAPLGRGVRAARAGVGAAVQLPALAPGGGQGQWRLALPGRATERAPLPRRLAPEPPGVRLAGRLPPTDHPAPNSVTVSFVAADGHSAERGRAQAEGAGSGQPPGFGLKTPREKETIGADKRNLIVPGIHALSSIPPPPRIATPRYRPPSPVDPTGGHSKLPPTADLTVESPGLPAPSGRGRTDSRFAPDPFGGVRSATAYRKECVGRKSEVFRPPVEGGDDEVSREVTTWASEGTAV
jgi:hypothetical protein